jgi:DNA-binding LytR/AlgR family response regulator
MNLPAQPTAIIAEDEITLAEELREMLGQLWPELKVVALAHNGGEALAAIAEFEPDIAFLDIRMPGLDGVQVAQQIVNGGGATRIVFVTAYDQHAVDAFDARAVDYLLKPVRRERLAETILRLKQVQDRAPAAIDADLLAALRAAAGGTARKYLRWINCGQGNEIDVIATSEVLYFQARDKYTCVITADKERYIRTPLRELINELDPDEFWQVHRASVIRVGALERAVRDDSGKLQLRLRGSKSLVPVSQAFAGRFRQM